MSSVGETPKLNAIRIKTGLKEAKTLAKSIKVTPPVNSVFWCEIID